MSLATAKLIRKRLRPNVNKFNIALHKRAKRLWTDAARAFVEAVIRPSLIQVDTGMAKATILPLARAVRLLEVARASIKPLRKSRKGFTDLSGQWNPTGTKSAATGEQLGEKAFRLNFGSAKRVLLFFEFRIVVFHYLLHEAGLVPGTGPWNSLEAGRAAFAAHISANGGDIFPRFNEWMDLITEIR